MKSDRLADDLGVTGNTATSPMQRHFAPVGGWGPADWIPERPAWQADAACRDSTVNFFPDRATDRRPARAVCMECPVRSECLEYALANNEKYGTWGGVGERERRRIRAERARALKAAS